MRTPIVAAILLSAAQFAQAEEVATPPTQSAPSAVAPFDERAAWCDSYATWLVQMTGVQRATPADVRDTHQLEVELNSCKVDPQQYERETRADAERATEAAQG